MELKNSRKIVGLSVSVRRIHLIAKKPISRDFQYPTSRFCS
jgi:hypothetical protein